MKITIMIEEDHDSNNRIDRKSQIDTSENKSQLSSSDQTRDDNRNIVYWPELK